MPNAHQTLIDKRASAWTAATSILDTASDEGRELTAEERSAYDAADAEVDSLTADIERYERSAKRGELGATPALPDAPAEHRDAQIPDSEAEYRSAFEAFARRGEEGLTEEQRSLLASVALEARAQGVGTASAGGYMVPPGFRDQIVLTMKDYGSVQSVAQVITTETGTNLQWPTNNDTGNVGALLAENTQISEQDVTIGTASLDAYVYTSKLVRVSWQLLQDSGFDFESFLANRFGERLGRITNQHFTTGTGSAQPDGIVTSAVSGKTAAGVAAITADELIDLEHSVDPAYRRSPRAKWMLSDTALASVRKLKDGDNQYLWVPGLAQGAASTLLGREYVINQDMAVPAAGVKSVLFGDFFEGYVIRIVKGIEQVRLVERYADYLQTGFFAYERCDGTVQNTAAYKALTQAAS